MSSIEEKLRKMEIRFDQEEFVVIDNGTGFIKAGFSGQDLPRVVKPTCMAEHTAIVEQNNNQHVEQTMEKKSYSYGNVAFSRKSEERTKMFEPISRGRITTEMDWDNMEMIWEHILRDELKLEPKNINLLMTDSPWSTKEDRKKMAEIVFDKFRVKSF